MKRPQKLATTLFSATLLLGMVPTAAMAAPTSSNGAIAKYAQAHQNQLGVATGEEECFENGACQQEFTKGLVTWHTRAGAHALTTSSDIRNFQLAGGTEKFGAVEGAAWKSGYCGQSVTTIDSKTRWMVVTDSQTRPGSYIDLNSTAGIAWKTARANTKTCFPDNATETLDWSKASFVKNQGALLLLTDTSAFVVAADAQGQKIADAAVIEVPWFKTNTSAAAQWKGTVANASASAIQALGLPTAAPVANGTTSTQQFENGKVTFTHNGSQLTTALTPAGLKELQVNTARGAWPIKDLPFTTVNGRFLTQDAGSAVFVYDQQSGTAAYLDRRVYKEYLTNPAPFGTIYNWYGNDAANAGDYYLTTQFQAADGSITEARGTLTASVIVDPANAAPYTINKEPKTIDPAQINWTVSKLSALQNGRAYLDAATKTAYVTATDDNYKAVAGAPVYSSRWLGYNMDQASAEDWTGFNQYEDWNQGDLGFHSKISSLGLPVAEAQIIVENGVSYEVQKYSGGTVKWAMPSGAAAAAATAGNAEINLNTVGQQRLADADAQRKAIFG